MSNAKNIMELTWKEIESLDKSKTALFVTFAPIEEHGHHMGLGVDIYEGVFWQNETIHKLMESFTEYNFLKMPFFPIAYGNIEGFLGNLYFKQSTLKQVTYELLENVVNWGINKIIIIASHGDPKHQIAIEEACDKINKKYGVKAFSPMGSFFSYKELKIDLDFPDKLKQQIEKYKNDYHAGWIETSQMININSSVVKDNYNQLPDIYVNQKEMISSKKVAKKIRGYGHIGYPKAANKELGELLNNNVIEFLTKTIGLFLKNEDISKYQHHFLYRIPFLRTNFVRKVGCILLIIVLGLYFSKNNIL
ncbi:creatininase family protein [Paramaledivibacter caminithermalis]|jgi:creatinine amidohydrolase|uniref:Creatinine amidohydrolase n=1 Tax=Paramaledivibacter caminithermalis (strain DSM 15212 / CIP 107654 / DViRD3) TaxID=1121301 RepID=A0A1M6JJC0_PARC5|nr:creatininase family protein [Paramaledivibacter caminithermalis]SHJ46799.1 creatinine amidohydrolase [Paramaledivibacter caminithermalis DSM 15212]